MCSRESYLNIRQHLLELTRRAFCLAATTMFSPPPPFPRRAPLASARGTYWTLFNVCRLAVRAVLGGARAPRSILLLSACHSRQLETCAGRF